MSGDMLSPSDIQNEIKEIQDSEEKNNDLNPKAEFDLDENLIDSIFNENDDIDPGFEESCEVIEKYSIDDQVNIKILYHSHSNEYIYKVEEPELTNFEKKVRFNVTQDVEDMIGEIDVVNKSKKEIVSDLRDEARKYINNYRSVFEASKGRLESIFGEDYVSETIINKFSKKSIDEDAIEKILYYIERDLAQYERLTPILEDEHVEDISCDSPNVPVFLYHDEYNNILTNVIYDEEELNAAVSSFAQKAGKHISIANPSIAGRLPEGHRAQLTLAKEISPKGSNFTIRKFSETPYTPIDLIEFGTFSLRQMAYLWLAIENDKSLIFAGGTASGKTTSMNAISLFIPPRAKVITIEDTQEIVLSHANWIQSVTRSSIGNDNSSQIEMYDLLRDALRQRPEYIIVGEIRGEEAETLFQAMSTGHTTYSTMHADGVKSAVNRLEHEPINLPRQMITALDILSLQIRTKVDGETERRCRKLVEIGDVKNNGALRTKSIFKYENTEDEIKQKSESNILEEIKIEKDFTDEEMQEEIERRKKVLEYMLEADKNFDYLSVTNVIRKYSRNKQETIEKIENGEL